MPRPAAARPSLAEPGRAWPGPAMQTHAIGFSSIDPTAVEDFDLAVDSLSALVAAEPLTRVQLPHVL